MPDSKITALTSIGNTTDPAADPLVVVDVSDTSMAGTGTTKKVTLNQLLATSPTATLASATITGDLTVRSGNKLILNRSDNAISSQLFDAGGGAGLTVNNLNGDGFLLKVASNNVYAVSSSYVQTWYDGAGGTRMTLNSTGLGVGGSPAAKLDVLAAKDTTTMIVGAPLSTVGGGAFANYSELLFKNTSGSNSDACIRSYGNVWNAAGSQLAFFTSNNSAVTERLRIDNLGNVGIGVTPSAWGGGTTAIQNRQTAWWSSALRDFHIGANVYYNGTDELYIGTAQASKYQQYQAAHYWYSAPSGTAGTAITDFATAKMTLDASGNLLVGVASNPNTARAYFRYDTLTIQPVINSASIVAASTSWNHFVGQSGNGSTVTTNNVFIRGNGDIVNANGVYGTISDLRLKENIADARNYLSDLLKLRVVNYSLKEEASAVANKLGFIAQEVEQVFPNMVDTDKEDTKSIKISVLIPMLVKAIQELTARVQTLEAK